MTNLGGMNGGILNSVLGGKLPIVGGLPGLGALGAPSFDIALATTFVTGVAAFFECDPKFKCPANDTQTLRNGGSGTSEKDTPNSANVSNAAANSKKLIPKPKPKINIPKGSGGNFL